MQVPSKIDDIYAAIEPLSNHLLAYARESTDEIRLFLLNYTGKEYPKHQPYFRASPKADIV